MRISTSGRIGAVLVLIATAAYAGWTIWIKTRTWVPLEMPISLSPGHIRSKEFKINLDARFELQIEAERKINSDRVPCEIGYLNCPDTLSILHVKWILYDAGKIVAQSDRNETGGWNGSDENVSEPIGTFEVEKGDHYVLDLEVLDDASSLNPANPRLQAQVEWGEMYDERGDYEGSLELALALFIFGVVLIVRAVSERVGLRRDLKSFATIVTGLHIPKQQEKGEAAGERENLFRWSYSNAGFRPRPRLKQVLPVSLSTFSVTFALTWSTLFLPYFLGINVWQYRSQGFLVRVLRPDVPLASIESQPAAVLVQIDAEGRCYVDYRQVELSELPGALAQAFQTRPDWVVYLDADANLQFKDAAPIMDIIRGAHGRIVLLTAGTKSSLPLWRGQSK
jgi:biopolymer transport protein ExbD